MPLTDLECRNIQPGDKTKRIFDEKGLYLEVLPAGGKYWRLKYRFGGKEKRLALGVYDEVRLKGYKDRDGNWIDGARELRDKARALLREGIDPGEQRRTQKLVRKLATESSFEAVAREWHAKQSERWVEKYAGKIMESLENDLFPALSRRPIAEISPPEILAVLRKIEARGALETVKRIRQRARDIFLYAIATGRVETNPVEGLHKAVKTAEPKRRPALHAKDLPEFFIRLDAVRLSAMVKSALRLLVLTFLRPGELRGAQWSEIDLDAGEWIIPAERDRARGLVGMKMREAHAVPLSMQAVEILRALQELDGERDLVFPNRNDPTRPISDGTFNSALRAMGYESGQVTGHGFRATATGALLELGFERDVIDRQLAHRERNQVFGAYSHQAQYMKERRKMMQAWADHVDALAAGANVIPIKKTAA